MIRRAFLVCPVLACIALAGCSLFKRPVKPIPPNSQQVMEYAQQQTALRNEVSGSGSETQQSCNQLAAATPGVEQIRLNRGAPESRQWTLVANGAERSWIFVRPVDGDADGWAPKPGLDTLNFQPPIEGSVTASSDHFLAYAPAERQSLEESQQATVVQNVFGAPQGQFTWRGRRYSYTLTSQLPCFPMAK